MEFLFEYGLFLAKAVTLVIAIAVTLGLILSLIMKHSGKGEGKGELKIVSISDNLKDMQTFAQQSLLSNEERKAFVKAEKKKAKAEKKTKKLTTMTKILKPTKYSSLILMVLCKPKKSKPCVAK